MKIALISDIHGNIPALEAVYDSINFLPKGPRKIIEMIGLNG
jgi:hypothetical protein